jgi:predicted glycogen debranching enzyme
LSVLAEIDQNPKPGVTLLKYCGDTILFETSLPSKWQGQAWLRTNIGHAEAKRREIIRHVDRGETRLGRDWYDIPMASLGGGRFAIELGLIEVGHFEAKTFFLEDGRLEPVWPPGPNTVVNVEPAQTCSANIVYNAFVRQFGPNKRAHRDSGGAEEGFKPLDEAGYTVIPPSGTFRDLITELDFIIGELGCRFIQLLPIHPTPTTYARMGRFGSPYAALSFTAVDPALAQFDPAATPLEQFIELVDGVHSRGALVLLDIAINHTGWAASLHGDHPEWLAREADGQIEVPGAWGIRWADLTSLDYAHKELWQYMADVFLTWCKRGVDGFRCDAGYMIPLPAWEYIIARVRQGFPDTIFLLEGLGGKISVTRSLLGKANFNWAYSELFQNYDRDQIQAYLTEANEISNTDGVTIHFAETHDNNRLAATSKTWARMRTALCALLSHRGAFAFANGVEWFATEKIDVHKSPSLNWGAADNQVQHIKRLVHLLKSHPAFFHPVENRWLNAGPGEFLAVMRLSPDAADNLLILVNLDVERPVEAVWDNGKAEISMEQHRDLLSDTVLKIRPEGSLCSCTLAPGQVLCLGREAQIETPNAIESKAAESGPGMPPRRIIEQRLRVVAMQVAGFYCEGADVHAVDIDGMASQLAADPIEFCRQFNPDSDESRVVTWRYPRDLKRTVMVPPQHFLLLKAPHPFRAAITGRSENLLQADGLPKRLGDWWILLPPLTPPKTHRPRILAITVHAPAKSLRLKAHLLFLSRLEDARVKRTFSKGEVLQNRLSFLGTNGRGGMSRARARWGELSSRYDALIAANLSPNQPEDRQIMLARMRAWVVFQGYSQTIGPDCLDRFSMDYDSSGYWICQVPVGQGEHVVLSLGLETTPLANGIRLVIYRHPAGKYPRRLNDGQAVSLILRPDIEDRNFHDTTKAYKGAENHFPASIMLRPQGFDFAPQPEHRLRMQAVAGTFVSEAEWQYMVYRALEDERGLDPKSDLFSPGYFTTQLRGGHYETIEAWVPDPDASFEESYPKDVTPPSRSLINRIKNRTAAAPRSLPLAEAMHRALDHFVVRRGDLNTVIAGYPWFLDWGRDTLIFVRGMIAAGKTRTVRAILEQFARFEDRGTIPNMIRGLDAGNRNTSDAPFWLFVGVRDLVRAEKDRHFLETDLSGRSLREVLISMARSIMAGTPNGIRMDPASGLIFSPAHFTWMDTNHPAGTPRQGYPVEIAALWYAALDFLDQIDNRQDEQPPWRELADRVAQSIRKYFYLEAEGYLSDCLHCEPGIPAHQAVADTALRPNQLFALTLGAIDDRKLGRGILAACEELLVPGAIRSLAPKKVSPPLAIYHQGRLLNDPEMPYQGHYRGDEDTSRKPAYHNGTAWTWVFPSYCEAWAKCYGKEARATALAWLSSAATLINKGCAGHLPEITDGDQPHHERGCDAQGWSVSELYRVWKILASSS